MANLGPKHLSIPSSLAMLGAVDGTVYTLCGFEGPRRSDLDEVDCERCLAELRDLQSFLKAVLEVEPASSWSPLVSPS